VAGERPPFRKPYQRTSGWKFARLGSPDVSPIEGPAKRRADHRVPSRISGVAPAITSDDVWTKLDARASGCARR